MKIMKVKVGFSFLGFRFYKGDFIMFDKKTLTGTVYSEEAQNYLGDYNFDFSKADVKSLICAFSGYTITTAE